MSLTFVPGAMSVGVGAALCVEGVFYSVALNCISAGLLKIAFGIGFMGIGAVVLGLSKCDKRDEESCERVDELLKQR